MTVSSYRPINEEVTWPFSKEQKHWTMSSSCLWACKPRKSIDVLFSDEKIIFSVSTSRFHTGSEHMLKFFVFTAQRWAKLLPWKDEDLKNDSSFTEFQFPKTYFRQCNPKQLLFLSCDILQWNMYAVPSKMFAPKEVSGADRKLFPGLEHTVPGTTEHHNCPITVSPHVSSISQQTATRTT
jgi:hypothetical protein